MEMGANDILQITAALGKMEGRLEGIGKDIADIKAGNMPMCATHTEMLREVSARLARMENGRQRKSSEDDSQTTGGMKMDFLRGLFTLSNISPTRATAVAKVGRDLAFGGMLLYLLMRVIGGAPTVEWNTQHNGKHVQDNAVPLVK